MDGELRQSIERGRIADLIESQAARIAELEAVVEKADWDVAALIAAIECNDPTNEIKLRVGDLAGLLAKSARKVTNDE